MYNNVVYVSDRMLSSFNKTGITKNHHDNSTNLNYFY